MTDTPDRSRRLEGLSPAKRRLLERRLAEKEGRSAQEQDARGSGSKAQAVLPIPRLADATAPSPLSFAQERFWLLEQLEPGNPAHHIATLNQLRGRLDLAAFRQACDTIVRRHSILRTRFRLDGDRPLQEVVPDQQIPAPMVDLAALPEAGRAAERQRLVDDNGRAPFDLQRGPPLRMLLLRHGDEHHELLVCTHHIASDGLSSELLAEEFAALYSAALEGRESPLPDLPVQYRDYAAWQREHVRGAALDAGLAWWTAQLANLPDAAIPADHPRHDDWTTRGRRESLELPAELLDALRAVARSRRATLYMTLLAAFKILLWRMTGEPDVVVGTPVATRTRDELRGLLGFFINSLVLRTDLSGAPGFPELLDRVRRTSLDAQDHQEIPFELVVDALQPERRLDRSPLFQVQFNYLDFLGGPRQLPDLTLEGRGHPAGSLYDLSLYVWVGSGTSSGTSGGTGTGTGPDSALRLEFEYDDSRFEQATVRRMLRRMERLLRTIAADPEASIDTFEVLPEDERALLATHGRGPVAADEERCLPELLALQAAVRPTDVAVLAGAASLDHATLDRRARRVAAALAARGLGPGQLVAVCLPRDASLLPTLLGVLRAGAAYLPLDPNHPAGRLAWLLSDARAAAVVTVAELRERLPAVTPAVYLADVLLDEQPAPGFDTGPTLTPDDRAYVLYTSGSTGQPKGVEVTHGNLVNLLLAMVDEPGLRAGERLAALTTLSFDIAGLELFGPLLAGGCVQLVSSDDAQDAVRLGRLLDDPAIDVAQATPSTWRMLQLAGWTARPGLRLLCGGEPLPRDLADVLLAGGADLWNLYGPTETTIWSTVDAVQAGPGPVAIGRPIRNTRVALVDAALRPVPFGSVGELLIGGAGVARGYLRRPELQAERFVHAPETGDAGRLYRTGDRARFLPDGRLVCLGRLDDQVKLRGHRIEPGEIEATLRDLDGVDDVAVALRRDEQGLDQLVAYVQLGVPKRADDFAQSLRTQLRTRLPEILVPDRVVALDALPRTPNGKLDRRALPDPWDADGAGSAADPTGAPSGDPPATPTERRLASLWADVLGQPPAGRDTSFFDAGGHSLLATALIARVRRALQVGVPLRAFFEDPTLAGLGARVEAAAPLDDQATPLVHDPHGPAPLSSGQQRMWFLDRLDPGSCEYVMAGALRLTGALDRAALEAALGALIARHDILRTHFPEQAGRAVAVVTPPAAWTLPTEDLSALDPVARVAAVRERVRQDARTPFVLATGPLVRAQLLRLSSREHVLLFAQHHMISDAWSMGVLTRELSALYATAHAGRGASLPDPALQYADYARWQQGRLTGPALARQRDAWLAQLADAPAPLELPADRPRPPLQSHAGARRRLVLDDAASDAVRALARIHDTTVFLVLLASFQTLLHRLTGADDVIVGTSIAGRQRVELEPLPGLFVNTLALRTRFDGDALDFDTLLERVKVTAHHAHEHQELPFEHLVEALNPPRDGSRTPLFQVFFDTSRLELAALALPGVQAEPLDVDPEIARFDLAVSVEPEAERLRAELDYNTDLFDAATIERLAQQWSTLLGALVAHPERPLASAPLLEDAERRRLLALGCPDQRPVDEQRLVHRRFQEQAAAAPQAPALIDGADALTRADLDVRANRLAQQLRALGVGPEVCVGVLLERCADSLVCLLAIWKAGGAYLPLDPALPTERLRFMLDDAGAAVVLTHAGLTARLGEAPSAQVVCVDAESDASSADARPPPDPCEPGHLAYVIYTSGSTGTPKGVLIEHRALVNHVAWVESTFGLGPEDRVLLRTPLGFDASIWELVHPLVCGALIVVAPPGEEQDARALLDLAARESITVLQTVPSLLRVWVDEPRLSDCRALRHLICAGEALNAGLVSRFQTRCRVAGLRVALHNLYGPSEACIDSTSHRCSEEDGAAPAETPIPIGRPATNVAVYVLDEQLAPQPVGVLGELCIGGAGLARGYLDRPELTATAFVPDPFDPAGPGGPRRLYRTGDLGRWLPDGQLVYVGRTDHQVKVSGQRIELGELEACLEGHPGVRQAVADVREAGPGVARLVAWVVRATGDGAPPDAAALRHWLARTLPPSMVPTAILFLDALPLTANEKVDRAALPDPDAGRPALETPYRPPRTDDERALAGPWGELLQYPCTPHWSPAPAFIAQNRLSNSASRPAGRVAGLTLFELRLFWRFAKPDVIVCGDLFHSAASAD